MRSRLLLAIWLLTVPPGSLTVLSAGPTTAAPTAAERVEVKRGASWYPATVIKREGNRALVHYDGLSNDFDEWVGAERMRAPAAQSRPGATRRTRPLGRSESQPEPGPAEEGAPQALPPEVTARLMKASFAGTRRIKVDPMRPPPKWAVVPETVAKGSAKLNDAPIALSPAPAEQRRPGRRLPLRIHEDIGPLLFAGPGAPRAVVGREYRVAGKPEKNLRIEVVDVAAGKATTSGLMPLDTKLLDVSPDGKHVLLRFEGWGQERNKRLDVFSLEKLPGEHVLSWQPYLGSEFHREDVEWAEFTDDAHVLTSGGNGRLVWWDWAKAKAVWEMELEMGLKPVVSPGGKQFAVSPGAAGLMVFDVATGRLLGVRRDECLWLAELCFRPDGKQLLSSREGWMRTWDLATGEPVGEAGIPPDVAIGGFTWLTNEYGLLDHRFLYDVGRGIALWEYRRRSADCGAAYGGRYWYILDEPGESAPVLVSAVLPHAEARKVAAGLKPEDYLAVRPGAAVTLEVNIEAPPGGREKVVKTLETKLKSAGLKIAANQPLKLVAVTTPGRTEEVIYRRMFGPRRGEEKVTVQYQGMRVALELDGKVLWERATENSPPHMVDLKENETIDQAVRKLMAEAWQFYQMVNIPSQVARVPEKSAYGSSELTAKGPQAAEAP